MKRSTATAALGVAVEPSTVRIERMLPGPVARVWAHFLDSEKRTQWLAAGAMDFRVVGEVDLRPLPRPTLRRNAFVQVRHPTISRIHRGYNELALRGFAAKQY